jgi:hypothetical protein
MGKSHDHAKTTSNFYEARKKPHSSQRPGLKDGEFYKTKLSNFTANLMLKSTKSARSHSFKFWKNGNISNSLTSNFHSTGNSNFPQQAPKIGDLFDRNNVFFTEATQGTFIKPDLFTTRQPKNQSVTFPN